MRHIPRKRFGQHFLTDHHLIDELIQVIAPRPDDCMIEIGPGLGALTLPLLEHLRSLTLIELDRDLVQHWREQSAALIARQKNLQIIASDVLKVDFSLIEPAGSAPKNAANNSIQTQRRIVGNLPYNISTPILFHLMPHAARVRDQHFMLQKEVVNRMVAKPCTADYGRLSVMLQWRYAMDMVLHVPPEAFDPPPRVQSAVVRMIPYENPAPVNTRLLEELVQVAFSQRRKLLRHSLGVWLGERAYSGTFDLHRRAEEVGVPEYIALVQSLS